MNLSKIDNYLTEMKECLNDFHSETENIFNSLQKKILSNKKRFTDNESYVFSKFFKDISFIPKHKDYLTETNLITDEEEDRTKVFKHRGIIYYTKKASELNIDPNLEKNINDFDNNSNMNEYSIFKKYANSIQKNTDFVYEKEAFSENVVLGSINDYIIEDEVKRLYGQNHFYFAFETGSAEGGSYTGREAAYEPSGFHMGSTDYPQFLGFFEEVCPDITYLQAERLKENIKNSSKGTNFRANSDYYGNYTDYEIYALDFKDLYREMKNLNINLELGNKEDKKNKKRGPRA